jgi:hypothetical protein
MALTRMRPKIPELRLALEGRFEDHHALMLSLHLGHIDQLTATIERLDEEVRRELDPFAEQVALLCTIPGIGQRVAEVVIAEIGVDMGRFPTAKHLASWTGLCPGHHESAGKRRSGRARKGDAALRVALCEAAWSAARTRDLTVPPGVVLGFLGPNGAGNATTSLILMDFLRPTGGTARVLGLDSTAEADLVVVGSRQGGTVQRLPLGSAATEVVHHAPRPVAVIPSIDR